MDEFEAKNVLGSIVIPALDDVAESVEWLRRDNYTIEELECMHFVGEEKPVIKKRRRKNHPRWHNYQKA